MLGRRRRRRVNTGQTLCRCVVYAGGKQENQKVVADYLTSQQLLHFGLACQQWTQHTEKCGPARYNCRQRWQNARPTFDICLTTMWFHANTKRSFYIGLKLEQRRRRWSNTKQTQDERPVFRWFAASAGSMQNGMGRCFVHVCQDVDYSKDIQREIMLIRALSK